MDNILKQIEIVVNNYPSLSMSLDKDGYRLTGVFTMNRTYNDVPLYDEYSLEIHVPRDFPGHIPLVYAPEGTIPEGFNHFLEDGSLCLGARCDLRSFLDKSPSLLSFIEEIVMSYLYSASYFRHYKVLPYGERSHGIQGIWEAYKDRYGTENEHVLIYSLCCLSGIIKYRGHTPCPCGSEKRFRLCHGQQILSDLQSPHHDEYIADSYLLLADYYRKRRAFDEKVDSSRKQV